MKFTAHPTVTISDFGAKAINFVIYLAA